MENSVKPAHYNSVLLCGRVVSEVTTSHTNHARRFCRFLLEVPRLSGQCDTLPILVPEELAAVEMGAAVTVSGQLRSYNNKAPEGPRLIISVLGRSLTPGSAWGNRVSLCGTLCKTPTLRRTPLGREICDLILAVNRRYGRADYLPCITWGALAQQAARLDVGDRMALEGRLQSRTYAKTLPDGSSQERTAYEVSVMRPADENPGFSTF